MAGLEVISLIWKSILRAYARVFCTQGVSVASIAAFLYRIIEFVVLDLETITRATTQHAHPTTRQVQSFNTKDNSTLCSIEILAPAPATFRRATHRPPPPP